MGVGLPCREYSTGVLCAQKRLEPRGGLCYIKKMTQSQLSKLRRLLVFAIVLAVLDVMVLGVLLYVGVIGVP